MAQFLRELDTKKKSVNADYYANISKHEKEKVLDKKCCISLQSFFRMFSARKKYTRLMRSVILIQRWFRGHLARTKFASKTKELFTKKNQKYFDYQARII